MANYEKDESGRFAFKADEKREVRSFRATSTTWKAIQEKASDEDMNVADYFEALVNGEVIWDSESQESETELDSYKDEVEKLHNEVKEYLDEALALKSRQGVLKDEKIKEVLELLGFEVED